MNKQGFFFSTDAMIALFVIILMILVAYPLVSYTKQSSHTESEILEVLSSLKIGDVNSSYVQSLINSREITDLNNSILEQIGIFSITNKTLAKNLASDVLSNLTTKQNFGIWYGNSLIYSENSTPIESAETITTDRQMISGINLTSDEASVTGFSARAYLSSTNLIKYFYFGGYVGDGNISKIIEYNGNISSCDLELAINKNFDVYVNNNFVSSFSASPSDFTPSNYSIPVNFFHSGKNILELRGENLYIGGGFIKISYNSSVEYEKLLEYNFPGINGIINLYDSFYVPGNLTEIEVFLEVNNSKEFFLTIGNTTVFEGNTTGVENITINNSELSSKLDYQDLSEKTIPLRLGFKNASYTSNKSGNADVFSVTDLSGSMCGLCTGSGWGYGLCCLFSGGCDYNQPNCESCGGYCEDMIDDAKDANKIFIDSVLNTSGNRVGLVGYATDAPDINYHQLSDDNASLKNKVDSWQAVGGTCICCGINRAAEDLNANSSSEKYRSLVVMSDGDANVECSQQGTGDPKQDAIQASCDAYNNYGIRVYSVGFGDEADEATLQAIANCGNGSYYFSDVNELADVYQEIAGDIVEASYNEQTIDIVDELFGRLYDDSYIWFNYTSEKTPYGLIINSEKYFDNDYNGSFDVPANSQILEAKVISYSGPRWTDLLTINSNTIYNLSNYGENYITLGDPYSVYIPNSYILEKNNLTLLTGISPPHNFSSGSSSNKIIYSFLKNISAYSEISAIADGCVWNLEFEDNTTSVINIPYDYSGSDICYYLSTGSNISNNNDALQKAAFNLLKLLDFDSNNKLDVKITSEDLKIESTKIIGIPYTWSTEVQVRGWS